MKSLLILLLAFSHQALANPGNSPLYFSTHSGTPSAQLIPPQLCFPNGSCISAGAGGANVSNNTGGSDGDIVLFSGSTGTVIKDSGITGGYTGFSTRFGAPIACTTLDCTLQYILELGYIPPTISLTSSPACGSNYEPGNPAPGSGNIVLTAHVGFTADPIVNAKFLRGVTLIDTETGNPPVPSGGNVSYTDSSPGWTTTTTYTATTTDSHPSTITSNNCSFNFIPPYLYGLINTQTTDSATLYALKVLPPTLQSASTSFTSSPTNQLFAFCQPSTFNPIVNIYDTNNFNITSDFSTFTGVAITNAYSNVTNYTCYEYNVPTTQVNFTTTYKTF